MLRELRNLLVLEIKGRYYKEHQPSLMPHGLHG